MSTTTLTPDSDGTTTGFTLVSSYSTYWQTLTSGNNANYCYANSSTTYYLSESTTALPSNVTAITSASWSVTTKTSSTKGSSVIGFSLGISGNATKLLATVDVTPTTSFATTTPSATINDSTVSAWSSIVMSIAMPNDGNNNTLYIADASVTLTVTISTGFHGLTLVGCGNALLGAAALGLSGWRVLGQAFRRRSRILVPDWIYAARGAGLIARPEWPAQRRTRRPCLT